MIRALRSSYGNRVNGSAMQEKPNLLPKIVEQSQITAFDKSTNVRLLQHLLFLLSMIKQQFHY